MATGNKKRGRGRPPLYTGDVAKRIQSLVREHGATGAGNVLNSRNGVVGVTKVEQGLAKVRKAAGFEKPLGISQPTILKLAKAGKIKLHRGRPRLEEAA